MEIVYTPQAENDLEFWKKSGLKSIKNRITRLLIEISENPTSLKGIGKPELLKHNYAGCISRRINDEHRLVYKYEEDKITILSMRFYYD